MVKYANAGGGAIKSSKYVSEPVTPPAIIQVYLDNGVVWEYEIDDPTNAKIREHMYEIVTYGYRSCHFTGLSDELVFYGPHRIKKVKCIHESLQTNYPDRARGT